jgi:hypothetical protein
LSEDALAKASYFGGLLVHLASNVGDGKLTQRMKSKPKLL